MKARYLLAVIIFSLPIAAISQIQDESLNQSTNGSWILGVGFNVVDDSATPFFEDFIKIKRSWNIVPYPSRLQLGRLFSNGLGIHAIGSYNRYKPGKLIDGEINSELREYYAIDGMITYDLNGLFGDTGWFDPYVHVGAGYSSIGGLGRSTFNGGFGFNTWFSEKWGLNFNTSGKWGLESGSTKQLQHAAGVVFRFGTSPKEELVFEEAPAPIEKIQEESEGAPVTEEKVVAVEEPVEKPLSAEEKKSALQQELDSLGPVFFAFDSYELNARSKETLDEVADIIKKNSDYIFVVEAHTDSRGPKTYNQWLSDQRAKSAVNYLISKGINSQKLTAVGYGEERLLNRCADGVLCTREEHSHNRRAKVVLQTKE
ncbi:OmpA family protein [Lentiprolixibacter aurantiacus]|uniref:OmpA family protein n=1 Tax=Lentiprolixibacter aurantiacus TaxID=2993939 RepID=A0AAE3MM05_9FLAO|nr:OmpA family protein [Lentiprolixibacter aurantiacus]MCX2719878.1 OmpA family protein [Lentiprolixibacter aurantiacus]